MEVRRLKGFRNTNPELIKEDVILTYKGKIYKIEEFSSEMVDKDQIFRSLSKFPRFVGNTNNHSKDYFYSVGQHSVLGSQTLLNMGKPKEALVYIFHDSPEAILGDINTVLKQKMKTLVKPLEDKIEEIIFKTLDVPLDYDKNLKKLIDLNLYEIETFLYQTSDYNNCDAWNFEKTYQMLHLQEKLCRKFLEFEKLPLLTDELSHFKS